MQEDDYADAFALEWNAFRTAHLDSFTGLDYLDTQFRSFLDFPIERLEGKLVLDAGCGLGRFSEVCLNHGASVVAVDLSRAIDAAYANLNSRGNIHFSRPTSSGCPFARRRSTSSTAGASSTTRPTRRRRSASFPCSSGPAGA